MKSHRVIVTRAQPQADEWVRQLNQLGVQAQALPLIVVRALEKVQWWKSASLGHEPASPATKVQALMFVSPSAVQYFFVSVDEHVRPLQDALRTGQLRAWSPGLGTAMALQRHGVSLEHQDHPGVQSAQFDSEHLWQKVHTQAHPDRGAVVIVRGRDQMQERTSVGQEDSSLHIGREWFTDQLVKAGVTVRHCVVYERGMPVDDDLFYEQMSQAREQQAWWLFHSALGLRHLRVMQTRQVLQAMRSGWPEPSWRRACAMVTHPRMEMEARRAGFESVQCVRPFPQDVVSSLELLS